MGKNKQNWIEQTITIISIGIVSAVIGILIYQIMVKEESPPDIVIKWGKIERKTSHFAIAMTVTNEGNQTAKDVFIEVIGEGAKSNEKAKIHFDYIPGKSSVKGFVTFAQKPDTSSLEVRILGYIVL